MSKPSTSDSLAIVGGISHILRGTFGELFGENEENSSTIIPRASSHLDRSSSPALIASAKSAKEIQSVSRLSQFRLQTKYLTHHCCSLLILD